MPLIRQLPEDVASRIAAGEVIERPASVLKELLENALDAGATRIQVETLASGAKLLRVADDGCGMDSKDCRLAFDRHATSKIKNLEDLQVLSTFGFRGEALASIAAVSKVTLTSCLRGSRKAWRVLAEGGRIKKEHEAPPADGTVVEVRELFYNTPARLKFLKSEASEKGHLARVIEEVALANLGVALSYKSEGRSRLSFPALKESPEGLPSRIRAVLGEDLGELLCAEHRQNGFKLLGFISPADKLVAARSMQLFFVNKRPVSSRLLQQALYRAYEPFRPQSRHPVAVVYLDLPATDVDVNVHPAKREVRFKAEREVFEALAQAVSRTLLKAKGIPALAHAAAPVPASPAQPYRTYSQPAFVREPITHATACEPEIPYKGPASDPSLRYLGQIEQSYLVFDAAGALLVVDQHAAQERILFERYLSEVEAGSPAVQRLMLPIAVELPASQVQEVLSRKEQLRRFGFELDPFGKTTLQVSGVPVLFGKAQEIKDMVHRLLDHMLSAGAAAADVRYHATATIACKAAVKAHDPLSEREALELVKDLKVCKDGSSCPHGRPTTFSLGRDELARRFKRPGAPPL